MWRHLPDLQSWRNSKRHALTSIITKDSSGNFEKKGNDLPRAEDKAIDNASLVVRDVHHVRKNFDVHGAAERLAALEPAPHEVLKPQYIPASVAIHPDELVSGRG